MPRIGKGEPIYDTKIVAEYFRRFTKVLVVGKGKDENGPPRKEIRVNGVEIGSQDSDWNFLCRLESRKSQVSLRRLDPLLCRFYLNLSDFELFYEEKCLG